MLTLYFGRVYVKQAALTTARELLWDRGRAAGLNSSWNLHASEWQGAARDPMQASTTYIARAKASQ
ncbi:MAG: hypothetical protein ABI612_20100 [Betaproteobacteria bacterium]